MQWTGTRLQCTCSSDRKFSKSAFQFSILMDEGFAVILANAAIWCFRVWYDRPGARRDLIWIFAFILWAFRLHLITLLTHHISSAAIVVAFNLIFLLLKNRIGLEKLISKKDALDNDIKLPLQAARPLIFPCRTTHTRMFPKKHSFSYSYLFVGIPIGWQGSVGSFLSADLESSYGRIQRFQSALKSWFSVEAQDHLGRGTNSDGLRGKLKTYLISQVGFWSPG